MLVASPGWKCHRKKLYLDTTTVDELIFFIHPHVEFVGTKFRFLRSSESDIYRHDDHDAAAAHDDDHIAKQIILSAARF